MKSLHWLWSVWRSYGSSPGDKPKAVDGGGIGLMELAKMVYQAKKKEAGNGGDYVKD